MGTGGRMNIYLTWIILIPFGIFMWICIIGAGIYVIGQIIIELKYSNFLKKLLKK